MRIIGIDLDGTLTKYGLYNPNIRLPWWLFYLLVPVVLLMKPDKMVVEKLQTLKNRDCEVIIVTARPIQLAWLTKFWLMFHCIPFDKLFCVGFGKGTKERKLKVIKKEKIEMFIDDNEKLTGFLRNNLVDAVNNIECVN